MKPLALDLFCGKGGATKGLFAAGWDVIGIDIEDMGGYPPEARLHLQDIKTVTAETIRALDPRPVGFVWASPPCQEFSYRSFPFKRCRELAKNVLPDKSLWEAAERIAKELNAPMVIENVRGAQPYMGKAAAHYGSFYLWGDVPAMLPIGCPRKGFQRLKDSENPSDPWGGFGGSSHGAKMEFGIGRTNLGVQPTYKKISGGRYRVHTFPGEYECKDPVTFKKMVGYEKYKNRFEDHESAQMSSKSNSRKEWSAKAAMIPLELSTWIGKCFLP